MHVDLDARVRWVNRAPPMVRREDVIGQHWLERIAPDYRDRMQAAFQTAASGLPASTEVPHTTADGRTHWFWCHFGPVRDEDGVVTGAIMIARDITERRELEQQLTVDRKS